MKKRQRKGGFSIIELLVAVTILAVAMAALGWGMVTARQMGAVSRSYFQAMNYARGELEHLVAQPFAANDLTVGNHTISRVNYTGRYTVTSQENGTMKVITLGVRYNSYFGRTKWMELQGAMSNVIH